MEDKGSDRTSNRTSVIFIGEAFLVPTFHYLPSSVGRWFQQSTSKKKKNLLDYKKHLENFDVLKK